jgi:hypothetical protein
LPGHDPGDDGRSLPPLREVAEISKPSTLGGLVYLGVLAAALTGVVIAAAGAWRTGVGWLGVSLLAAAGARLALPDDNAGMLRVRRKLLDALLLTGLGVSLLFLAATIPDQPG